MILEDTVDFFLEVPPLCLLPRERLFTLARQAHLEYYPAKTLVLGPGGLGNGYIHVVKKGALTVGQNLSGPGAMLGVNPVIARAEQDTLCCLLGPEALAQALAGRPELEDFLAGRFSPGVLEMGLAHLMHDSPDLGHGRPLAILTAGEAASGREARVSQETPLERVAKIMTRTHQNAMLVTNGDGWPTGVVTDLDFRAKALAQGLDPKTQVSAIMSQPVISVPAEASCFEALLAMTRHGVHQVVVMGGREVLGLVTARQLMALQTGSAPSLAQGLDKAQTPGDLARVAAEFEGLALGLMRQGALASSVGGIIGGLRERLAARAAQMAEQSLGEPPGAYALLFLGRAASRGGPTFGPLWTGLIWEDALQDDGYFARLSERLVQTLDLADLGPGHGGPWPLDQAWRGSLSAWKERYEDFSSGCGALASQEVLDFRPVYGQAWLGEALRAHVGAALGLNQPFLASLAQQLPSGQDQHPGQSLAAISGAVRLMALQAGISRISSMERARELGRVHPLGPEMAQEAANALEYLEAWQWLGSPEPLSPLAKGLAGLCSRIRRGLRRFLPRPNPEAKP